MTRPRIYFPRPLQEGEICELGEDHRRYLKSVLRLAAGDPVVLFDGDGVEYQAVIESFTSGSVRAEVKRKARVHHLDASIHLCQSLPKHSKMDFIVQKATELGVAKIIPFSSARSVPRLTGAKASLKASRWQKIAVEAARQSGRSDVPEISPILSFDAVLQQAPAEAFKMIFWEEETLQGLREVFQEKRGPVMQAFLIVGPEGGFSREEVDSAKARGFVSVSLGRQVLKVETAAVSILSIIQYEIGNLGRAPGRARERGHHA